MPTHYKGDAGTVRALNAYINFIRASDSVIGRTATELEGYGLTVGQFGVLEALLHLGPLCQHALAEKLLRSGGNITLVVDNLEKHGWVRRERQKDDRRLIRIHLTPEGRRLIGRVFPEHARAVTQQMSRLNPREQETLRRLARKLGRGIEKDNKENEHDSDSTE